MTTSATALRLVAANAALLLAWVGILLFLGFTPGLLQITLLAMGVACSAVLVSRHILGRAGTDVSFVRPALPDVATDEH